MPRFADPRLEEIYLYRASSSLPGALIDPAFRLARRLVAARNWSTVGVFTQPVELSATRYASPVHDRWHISFAWDDALGAFDMALERLKE